MSNFKGHCQCCLRQQAVNDKTGKLSLHGYKVAGYGYFHGTCNGSRELPLEQDTTLLDREVELLNLAADKLDRRAAKGPEAVKKVPVQRRCAYDRYKTETVLMTRDEFIQHQTLARTFRPEECWDHATKMVILQMTREAKYLREFAVELQENRDKIHGRDLIDVRAIEAAKPVYEVRKKFFKFESTSLEMRYGKKTPVRDDALRSAYREAREFLSSLNDNPNAKTKNVRRNTGYLQIQGPFKITRNGEWDGKTWAYRVMWQHIQGAE